MGQHKSVIVSMLRTPFAKTSMPSFKKKKGTLGDVDPVDMIVPLVNQVISDTNLDPSKITKVITGCVHQEAEQGLNLARLVVLHDLCVLPDTVGGTSLDRFCGSSLEAIALADGLIARNPDSIYLCTGVQSMSKVDMGGNAPYLSAHIYGGNVDDFKNMGLMAENLTQLYHVPRKEQDEFSLRSHKRAMKAKNKGNFNSELVSVNGVNEDDGIRADINLKGLSKLSPVFKAAKQGGTVTAGNASQVSDGASLVMVTSESYAKQNNLPILAEIVSFGESGTSPDLMGVAPVPASDQALKRAGISYEDLDLIELNEAFAVQSLAVIKEWENQGHKIDSNKINIDGGAIAIGHPLGASGARLVGHLAYALKRENKKYGLATMCIGGGQGVAMVIKNPSIK